MTDGDRAADPGPSRAAITFLVVVMLVVAVVEIAGGLLVRRAFDDRRVIDQDQLAIAMQTFRPADRAGLSRKVPMVDLGAARSVRSDPASCSPLSLLATSSALDGASWSGVGGRPLQPVMILTVRFAGAEEARAQLWRKRYALLSCSNVALTFPPFEDPAQRFSVHARTWPPSVWLNDRMAYALVSQGRRYEFYVRRYRNTLIWSYGDPEGVALRRGIVDDLARRMSELRD